MTQTKLILENDDERIARMVESEKQVREGSQKDWKNDGYYIVVSRKNLPDKVLWCVKSPNGNIYRRLKFVANSKEKKERLEALRQKGLIREMTKRN